MTARHRLVLLCDVAFRLVLLALWIVSLMLPAAWSYDAGGHWNHLNGPVPGLIVLAAGWAAMFEAQFGWCANLLFFPALLRSMRPRTERFGWTAWLFVWLVMCLIGALCWTEVPGEEDNVYRPYGLGRTLWLVAIAGATVRIGLLTWLGWRNRRRLLVSPSPLGEGLQAS